MTPHALLFTLAAIGISETAYLIKQRWALSAPVCPVGHDCTTVLESKYNKTFGIHNDIAGFAFYVLLSFLAAALVIEKGPMELMERVTQVFIGAAALTSLYFTFLQWRIIKAWCFWCLMSAGTIGIMALVVLTSNLTP